MQNSGQIIFNGPRHNKKTVEESQKDSIKETLKEEQVNQTKFDNLANQTHETLFSASSVFPFDFFPDEIRIERQQIHVVSKQFFGSERRHSVHIKDLTDIFIDTSPFFASLKLIDKNYVENIIEVKFLKLDDAQKIRRLVQGLIVAHREQIDLSLVKEEEIVEKLENIGAIKQP